MYLNCSVGKDSWEFLGLQHHSSKASILRCSAFFTVRLSHPYMTTGKTIALTRRTFVGKVMSLLLNMLSRLVITFLPRSKRLLISWLQSPSAVILEPKKIKSDTFHCFPIYFPWSDGVSWQLRCFFQGACKFFRYLVSIWSLLNFTYLLCTISWHQTFKRSDTQIGNVSTISHS